MMYEFAQRMCFRMVSNVNRVLVLKSEVIVV